MASTAWFKQKKVLFSQKILAQTLTCALSLISLNMLYSQQGSIIGPTTVCGGCHEYSVEFQTTGEERYEWVVLIDDDFVTNVGNTKDVVICWDEFFSNGSTPQEIRIIVSIIRSDESFALETAINIQNPTSTSIISIDAPPCPSPIEGPVDSISCSKVCTNTIVNYTLDSLSAAPGTVFYEVQWDVSGAESFEVDFERNTVQVNWGDSGLGQVSAFLFDGACESFTSTCVQVVDRPKIQLTTSPPLTNNELTICRGEEVQFQNETAFAERYEWQFGSLGSSDLSDPTFTFEEAGTHSVTLVAYNECNCLDSTSFLVKVLESESPSLSCLGTVCAGETVTYNAEQSCGQYEWVISDNGQIVEGGGLADDFVTVLWESGSLGVIDLLVSDCGGFSACPTPTSFEIPILSDDAEINGPSYICEEAIEAYHLPSYSGTTFTWQTSNGGMITDGQGTNEITVDWSAAIAGLGQQVIVQYENCFLGCGGSDTLEVQIRPTYRIEGPAEVCTGENISYVSLSNADDMEILANWFVLSNIGDTVWRSTLATATPLVDAIDQFGNYTLYAQPDDPAVSCTTVLQHPFRVLAPPSLVEEIVGDTLFCLGQVHNYQIEASGVFDYEWEITNGNTVESKQGASINVEWGNSPPYNLQVIRVSRTGAACRSMPRSFSIAPFTVPEITGLADICLGDAPAYSVDLPLSYNVDWSVDPASSSSLFVKEGFPVVQVIWGRSGAGTISLEACGQTLTKGVTVNDLPEPTPVLPAGVCSNETAVVPLTETYAAYSWLDENDNELSTDPNFGLSPGTYQVLVTDANGCNQDTAFTLVELGAPIVSISTPDFNVFCNSAPQARLFALEGSQGYQYQWFRDGNPVGTDSPLFTATAFGRYWVEASNALGCVTRSNEIALVEDCSGGNGGGIGGGSFPNCPAGASPDINIMATANCNERSYESLSSGMVAGTATWFFDDPDSGPNNTSNLDQPTHTYTRAGYFRVLVLADFADGGDVGGCFAMRVDTIPIAANFISGLACSGATVDFTDLSTFLPGNGVTAWSWDFGDPASGAANISTDQNPSHTYVDGGDYTVTLTISATDGCVAQMSKVVSVRSAPVISVVDVDPGCEDVAKSFTISSPEELIRVYWDMGDPNFDGAPIEGESIAYVYQDPGSYTLDITAVDIYGCQNTIQESYTSLTNTLAGQITSSLPNPICQGDSTLMSPPPGGDSWSWWLGQADAPIQEEQIWVKESQVVRVDVETAEGCLFRADPVLVEFQPSPTSFIRAVELDENGQILAYHYDGYEACSGADVILEGNANPQYSFIWSNGTSGPTLAFTKESGNVLSPGTYEFTLQVTDNATVCRQVIGPFTVTIHQNPAGFAISSDQNLPLCPGQNINLSVNNPDASLDYTWNTGETGTTIVANAGGSYQAIASNGFGCESQSNVIEVIDFPAIDLFPSGCHTRCNPDTICLPSLPNVVNIQWLKDGVALTGPEATQPNLPIDESGSYSLLMEDANGCSLESGSLNLELLDGFGDISGAVYYDVNGNGVIDAADTTVSGVTIQLSQTNVVLEESTSSENDGYLFEGIPGDDYTLVLDTMSVPSGMMANLIRRDTSIMSCDEMIQIDWLLSRECVTLTSTLDLVECPGNLVTYNGTTFASDTSFVATYQDILGCDSLETVNIQFTEVLRSDLVVSACEGTSFEYQGVPVAAGDTQVFTLTTTEGCDSIVNLQVQLLPTFNEDVELFVCPGETLNFDGDELSAGQSQSFTLTTEAGCDSVVNVTVSELPTITTNLNLSVCPGSTVEYEGQVLAGGTQQQFVFVATSGCDSLVNVVVEELGINETELNLQACVGEKVMYNGVEIEPGQSQTFVLQSVAGCDSTVQVNAAAFPALNFELETTSSCEDSNTGSVQAINLTGPILGAQYRVDDQVFGPNPLILGQTIGAHTFAIEDENGCLYEQAFVITSIPAIEVASEATVFPCSVERLTISPTILSGDVDDLQFEWDDGSTAPELVISMPGIYPVKISNACESVIQNLEVQSEYDGNDEAFYIPNAFSPNDDGINEELKVLAAPDVIMQSFDLYIFDRWGNQIFKADEIEQGWNGRLNGKMLDSSVFVWIMEATFERCGQSFTVQRKGDVVLMW